MRPLIVHSLRICLGLLFTGIAHSREYQLNLSSASVDRAGEVITFTLPEDAPKNPALRSADGKVSPIQLGRDRTATFVVPWQARETALTFSLIAAQSETTPAVKVTREAGDLTLAVSRAQTLGYRMDPEKLPRPDIKPEYKRAGYLFPVYTPAGKLIADDYPAQHIHHHGIWAPWTKTQFQGRSPDFWNMGAKTGTVEFVGLDQTWEGPVSGGFSTRHRMVDLSAPSPVVALNETWEVQVYAMPGARAPVNVFDLVITQTCATGDPLILPEYRYGGLGFRGPGHWYGETNSQFLTSNGERDRVKAHTTRASWICQYGEIDGGTAGLTILGHPGNVRAPQPLRVHPKEPFICFSPSQMGEWRIEPGTPYHARYRFVVMDGPPDAALLEAYWQGYAQPAQVTLALKK